MITVFVQFILPEAIDTNTAKKLFVKGIGDYVELPGLIRKYYLNDPENGFAGGCYLFESRADADALFDSAWHEMVTAKYGTAPVVKYFDSPVIVDNSPNGHNVGVE